MLKIWRNKNLNILYGLKLNGIINLKKMPDYCFPIIIYRSLMDIQGLKFYLKSMER